MFGSIEMERYTRWVVDEAIWVQHELNNVNMNITTMFESLEQEPLK
jgi:hypothetical protein